MHGEESHSGSHSLSYGQWEFSAGGSMIGKGCHPLAAAIYLKYVEGRVRNGIPIRPRAISARTHTITRMTSFKDEGYLKRSYRDVEDFAMLYVVFEDETIADEAWFSGYQHEMDAFNLSAANGDPIESNVGWHPM